MPTKPDIRRELAAVPESPLVQIATLAESMRGSIKLCYGESDLPTPAFVTEAAHRAALDGHTFYTHTAGYRELRFARRSYRARSACASNPSIVGHSAGSTRARPAVSESVYG